MTTGYVRRLRSGYSTLWTVQNPRLAHLDIELTERCNLNCIHCYINQPAGDRSVQASEMKTGQVKIILREACELGALSVRFTGGEPLLRTDFAELYLFARQMGLSVSLFTNGTLLSPELADLFAHVPPRVKIEITIYGMTPENYKAVTGVQGGFSAAQRGIDLLREYRVPFLVKGVYLPPNRREIDAFEDWAASLSISDVPPGIVSSLNLRGRRDSAEKNKQIKALRPTAHESLRILTRESARYYEDMEQFCGRFMGPPGDKLFRCGAGRRISVDAYGKVQPCMLLRDPQLAYDLNEHGTSTASSSNRHPSLQDALLNFFPQLSGMRGINSDYLARCARCFLHGLCGQCPAKSWMEHGTLDTPVEYECSLAHVQARELGLLSEDEKGWEIPNWRQRLEGLRARATN
ncbi:MAG: radical SAM protein [Chloroflexi bacterium]|nr:radical SAM protein [Chloroflexota bacterium]